MQKTGHCRPEKEKEMKPAAVESTDTVQHTSAGMRRRETLSVVVLWYISCYMQWQKRLVKTLLKAILSVDAHCRLVSFSRYKRQKNNW